MAEQRTRRTRAAEPGSRAGARVALATASRVGEALVVLVLLASLVFFALRLLPGDPAALVLGDQATPEQLAVVRARLHLDEPLLVQYLRFLRGLVQLDLGESLRRPGTGAMARVGAALGPTSGLAGLAVAIGAAMGVAAALATAGPWLGRGRRWVERGLVVVSASPLLAFAPLATYALAARARIVPLPGDPEAGFAGLAFASTLLSIPLAAQVGRTGRAALAEIANAQFLTVARAKGASPSRVWLLHALPVVTGPIVTVVATQLGALLGGAVVLERLFERAGLGTLILEAYASRDLPVLEGAVVAAGALFVAAQGIAAVVHAAIDPRVRA
jgi:peptide/nickel transport system permease protein